MFWKKNPNTLQCLLMHFYKLTNVIYTNHVLRKDCWSFPWKPYFISCFWPLCERVYFFRWVLASKKRKKWCQWTFILFKWQALCTVILNTVNHSFNLSLFHSFFKAATSVLNIRIKNWQYVHRFPCHSQRKVSNKTI